MASITDPQGRPRSGVVPFAVVGLVTDNVDPDSLGRIRVQFPALAQAPESWWLRQVTPNASAKFGFYSLPEIGDEVLVVFLQGNQNRGVVLGQVWNGTDPPPSEAAGGMPGSSATMLPAGKVSDAVGENGSTNIQNNDRRFWRSRSGALIAFDDTDGAESVQIWNSTRTLSITLDTANDLVVIANTAGDVHVRAAKNLVFEATEDIELYAGNEFKLTSGLSSTVKTGTEMLVTAGTSATYESTTDTTVEAGANLVLQAKVAWEGSGVNATLKGTGAVKVEGGAMVSITAWMVKIN